MVCSIVPFAVGTAGTLRCLLVLDFLYGVRGSSHCISRSVYGCIRLFIKLDGYVGVLVVCCDDGCQDPGLVLTAWVVNLETDATTGAVPVSYTHLTLPTKRIV